MAGLVRIRSDDLEVEVLPEIGGRVHRMRAFGHDLLRTPGSLDRYSDEPVFWGAYPMAPWCNRLSTTATGVGDRTVELTSNFTDGTAIHGQVATVPWTVADDGSLSVQGGGNGWPWRYAVEEQLLLDGPVLTLGLRLTNLDTVAMPGGLGLHPWFRKPLDIRVPARTVLASNLDPAAVRQPVGGRLDLRRAGPVPVDLDGSWLDFDEDVVELRWPDLGIRASLRWEASAPTSIAIASPRALDGVAVEPQTHLPDGLRRWLSGEPGGLTVIEPGASLELAIELAVERSG
jgi:aldose 1-epimerase